jgi:hypothetical protein
MIKSSRVRWDKNVTDIGKTRVAYYILVGNNRKKPLGQPRNTYKEEADMDIWETGCGTKTAFKRIKLRVQHNLLR